MGDNQQRPPAGDAETVPIASPGAQDVEFTGGAANKTLELAPGTEVGGYVIDNKIGEGGMGQVYGAKHPRIGKRVAIKVLAPAYTSTDPAAVNRFEQEARLVNQIHHPNIVDVFQFGELPDKRNYFVMEWLDGESLSARIERGAIPAQETMEILDVVCDALDAAHEKGVIHRDLKSDNVFLVNTRGKRTAKLLDFGVAKLSNKGDVASVALTRSGIVVGTPAYMSPEQARGKAVDGRTDVYALGVLAYKMLTGALPFKADNPMDMIASHLAKPPPSPDKAVPQTPGELARLVVRMMAKAPEERPTLADIRATFAKLRDSKHGGAPAPRRATSVLIGVMLFLAGVVALGTLWLIQRKSQGEVVATASGSGEGSPTTPGIVTTHASSGGSGSAAVPPAGTSGNSATPPSGAHAAVESAASTGSAAGSAAAPAPGTTTGNTTPTAPSGVTAQPTPGTAATGSEARTGSASRAGSGAGSAAPKKRGTPKTADEPELVTQPPPANRPGAILLTLDIASEIEINGSTVAQSSYGGRYEVKPGTHEIRVKAPGRQPVVRSVTVEPGGNAVLRIDDDTGE
jgi:serine/threonine-protein kinase